MDSKELRGLAEAYQAVHAPQEVEEAVYGGDPKKPAAPKDDRMVVTNADKKANTKAYQNFKAGVKGYKSADHLGEGVRDLDPEKGTAERKARLEKKREMKLDDHPEYKKEKSVDEAVKGASRHDTEMRKAASKERKSGIKNRLSPAAGKDNADKMQRDVKFFDKLTKKNRNVVGLVAKEEVDIFDTILEYLVAEGYADTNESALVIMANMSEEWRQSIVEVKLDPRGRPASGPMNVYKQSKPNTDPAFQAALKSVRDADAKKTPEQRKAELDAYRERQMNNK